MLGADTSVRMRLVALTLLVLGLSASAAAGFAVATSNSLLIEDGRGLVVIKGKGGLIGHIDKGSLEITDLTPNDQWSPYVNGVPRGKVVWIRANKLSINFRVPGGRYRIVARGSGISISARGTGQATIDPDPDAVGEAGRYAVGDNPLQELPADPVRLSFGPPDPAPSGS
jgi:hypothetical protein